MSEKRLPIRPERPARQLEFDFEQYGEPRRVSAPVNEYFRKAFNIQPLGAPVKLTPFKIRDDKHLQELIDGVPHTTSPEPVLSQDSEERKNTPIFSGVLQYFPLAVAAVARHSKRGNDKHNPGQPLHWAREKSDDHADCISRHLVDVDHYNAEIDEYEEAAALAWRALAKLQLLEEKRLGRSK